MKTITNVLRVLGIFLLPGIAFAHVAYVLSPQEMAQSGGENWSYIAAPFLDINDIVIMISTIVIVVILLIVAAKVRPIRDFFTRVVTKLKSYNEFIPWIIRLALGIALIGAGMSEVLISPTFVNGHAFALLEFALGFFFLMGFLIVPSAIVAIVLFLFGVVHEPYLLGNLDFLALAIGVLLYPSPRPGLDDILSVSFATTLGTRKEWIAPIIRIGLGVAFIYLALHEKLLNPGFSALVVSKYHLMGIVAVSPNMWVLSSGLIELVLGLLLVIGLYTRLVSVVAIVVISLTFFYFKEAVYAHVTLFSSLAVLAIEGGGMWSIDKRLFFH